MVASVSSKSSSMSNWADSIYSKLDTKAMTRLSDQLNAQLSKSQMSASRVGRGGPHGPHGPHGGGTSSSVSFEA